MITWDTKQLEAHNAAWEQAKREVLTVRGLLVNNGPMLNYPDLFSIIAQRAEEIRQGIPLTPLEEERNERPMRGSL